MAAQPSRTRSSDDASSVPHAGLAHPRTPNPTTILILCRALRDFGDGFCAILLPAYLLSLGLGAWEVGIISTVSLLGSSLLTLCIAFVGHRWRSRELLLAAAALMIATGVAFALVSDFAITLVVAFFGAINPSSGSVSVFVPLEHAALTASGTSETRTRTFARYSLAGSLAAAVGALISGLPELVAADAPQRLAGIKIMFILYAALGVIIAVLYRFLPRQEPAGSGQEAPSSLGPSRSIVLRLALLFSLDSFAGGFVVQSLLALWLFERFELSLAAAGAFFFWTGVLSAFSYPVASWIATKIGLVNTMVFTHIPSSIALIFAALSPSLPVALGLLLVRAALSQMDVPTRSSYVMAVVTPPERAAAASFTAVPRSLAAAASPALAGAMMTAGFIALPLLLCGSLKIAYDLLLLWQFRHVLPPEERRA